MTPDDRPITVSQMVEAAAALGRHKDLVYWPPLSLRGSIKECHEGGKVHWHWEAVCQLPGGVIGHYMDMHHYGSAEVALAVLDEFAHNGGITDFPLQEHDQFEHSSRPEVEAMEERDRHEDG
jgi:hypothetical protein